MAYIIKFSDCGLVLHEPTDERKNQPGAIVKPAPDGFTVKNAGTGYLVIHEGVALVRCHYLAPQNKVRHTYQNTPTGTWKNQVWEPNQWVLVSTSEFCVNETMSSGFVNPETLQIFNDDLQCVGIAGEKRTHDRKPYSGSQYPHVNFGII